MFHFRPGRECQDIKAIVFLIKSTEEMRDKYIHQEKFEEAADWQEQIKHLKASLFNILISDKFSVDQNPDGSIILKGTDTRWRK